MKEILLENIDVIVTIIGFIITYKMTIKSFGDEIRKSKISHNIEMIHSLPYEVCELMTKVQKSTKGGGNNSFHAQEYEKLMTKIFAYGSSAAVTIITEVQQTSYRMNHLEKKDSQYRILILYALLITQLKYDISDEIVSPENWFKLKINDYYKMRKTIVKEINEIVSELELNEKFYVEK